MRENRYQRHIVERLHMTFDRPLILKNDANLIQGIMDLTVVTHSFIFFLEVKASEMAPFQPNQEYYLNRVQEMGHNSWVVYPENEEEVWREIYAAS